MVQLSLHLQGEGKEQQHGFSYMASLTYTYFCKTNQFLLSALIADFNKVSTHQII